MSWFDNQDKQDTSENVVSQTDLPEIEIMMPNSSSYVRINKHQIERKFNDELGPRLLIIVDEVAELLQPTKVKTEQGKEEDSLKQEISGMIQSLTQLGRSAGIHMILATQRNSTDIINGTIQNNCTQRIIAGRLNSIASLMAAGSTIATLIPVTPGRGAVSVNGKFIGLQHYFATHSWIEEWFQKRGFDKNGYPKFEQQIEEVEDTELLDGEEEIKKEKDITEFEFQGIQAKIDKTKEQIFEEL